MPIFNHQKLLTDFPDFPDFPFFSTSKLGKFCWNVFFNRFRIFFQENPFGKINNPF